MGLWKIEMIEGKAKEIKILEKSYVTSVNGAFEFEYIFLQEKEYYLAFDFEGRKGGDFHYVVKPRLVKKEMLSVKDRWVEVVLAFIIGCGITYLIMWNKKKRK